MSRSFASLTLLAPALVLATGRTSAPPEKVQLTMATLHAAALTTSRAAGDSTDAPFLIVSVSGPHTTTATILPESGPVSIRRDESIGARPLTELSLADGDSAHVLVSVLENAGEQVQGAHWLGSVSLVVTNEGGAIYWRQLDCVASCKVLSAPAATALPATGGKAVGGIVELSGNGGTYHLALQANRG
jgi:hypothetical protein